MTTTRKGNATTGVALQVPAQAAPIARGEAVASFGTGVEADLWGLPIGDWIEAPGAYAWQYAKDWLNS
ncbi:hypothetical protein [Amycolatopsis alkalitolerans]|uniref:Uncharacterized protein n=1 Tax=Amycolatopsis alkalitolerans TaxID=2547244 RepID=A0A5C4LZW8_9PSEU|nr:hypothetical protein [Amycolatopsis alkalitolerans]TNC25711.1 hypothetical protein FG385_13745 [Amycolatopsis alkalitolerans]